MLGRIVCQLVNEAAFAIGEGVGSGDDVDAGLTLGLNHPRGAVAWGEAIGLEHVLATIDGLWSERREERYRPLRCCARAPASGRDTAVDVAGERRLRQGLVTAAETMDKDALLAALPDLIAQTCDPEIEWVEDPTRADGRVYRGHDGVRASWEQWLENFDEYGVEIETSRTTAIVFMAALEHGRGSASNADVRSHIYVLYTFRDGKILRYQEFYDEQDARAALEP